MNVYLVSLGCARNLVDSEVMLGHLSKNDWKIVQEPDSADAIVINTCSFIASAVDESIDTILELAEYKKTGRCRYLVVAGCLPERYREDIVPELPEVDLFLGTGAAETIARAMDTLSDTLGEKCFFPDPNSVSPDKANLPRIQSSAHMAYIKIAEGCSRHCTYCIIPKLRGKYRSRTPDDILAEARLLIASGTKELILVAESTTDYGLDLSPNEHLDTILETIAAEKGDFRLRLLYGFPDTITDAVINCVGKKPNICTYFDIPIQHASDRILKTMGRRYTQQDLFTLFNNIRDQFPEAALRTTLIVGFPGETDEDFNEILGFIRKIRFDHLGVFTYSDSEDIPSHHLSDHVPEEVAQKRQDLIMAAQADISLEKNMTHINNTYRVLIEENPEEGVYLGRTSFQAPDVDGITFVYADDLETGTFVDVTITDAYEYDLAGAVT